MTEEEQLVHDVRLKLFRHGYPPLFAVSLKELEAVEKYIEEYLLSIGEEPILKCGKHGLYFKGCQLVLLVS